MQVNKPANASTRNVAGETNNFFQTQPDISNNQYGHLMSNTAPRTGSLAMRTGKLLTPASKRLASLNASQPISPMRAINSPDVNSLEIERERNKVARFLHTKERMGAMLANREVQLEDKIKKMEKKQLEYEKRKRVERKMALERVNEK